MKTVLLLIVCLLFVSFATPAVASSKLPWIDNGGDLLVPDHSTSPPTLYMSIVVDKATRVSVIFPNHKFRTIKLHKEKQHGKPKSLAGWQAYSKQKGLVKFASSSKAKYTYKACNRYGCVKAHYHA